MKHVLSKISTLKQTAVCDRCGPVTIHAVLHKNCAVTWHHEHLCEAQQPDPDQKEEVADVQPA